MDSSEAVKDNTIDTISTDTGNVQILNDNSEPTVRTDLEDILSFSVASPNKIISESIDSDNKPDLIGSILKDSYNQAYTNVDSTSRTADVPLPSSDNANILDKNTEVLQSSLLEYSTEPQIPKDDKMDVDEDDSKLIEGAVIVSEDSVSGVKDYCLPVETNVTNSNMDVPESESDIVEESKEFAQPESEIMETDIVTNVEQNLEKSDSAWKLNTETDGNKVDPDRTVSEVIDYGNQAVTIVSDSDDRVSDLNETPIDKIENSTERKTLKSDSEDETQTDLVTEQSDKEDIHSDVLQTYIDVAEASKVLVKARTQEQTISHEVAQTSKEVVEPQSQVKDPQNEVVEIQDDIEEIQEDVQVILNEEEQKQENVQETHDGVEKIHDDVVEIQDEVEEIQDDVEEIQDDVEEIHDEVVEIPDEVEEIQDEVEQIQDEVEEIQDEVEETQDKVEKMRDDVKEIQDEVEEVQNDVVEIQDDVEEITYNAEQGTHAEPKETQVETEDIHTDTKKLQTTATEPEAIETQFDTKETQDEPQESQSVSEETQTKLEETRTKLEETQTNLEETLSAASEETNADLKESRDESVTPTELEGALDEMEETRDELKDTSDDELKDSSDDELKDTSDDLEGIRNELKKMQAESEKMRTETDETLVELEDIQMEVVEQTEAIDKKNESTECKIAESEETGDLELEKGTVETESEMMETEIAGIETENKTAETETDTFEVDNIEQNENDVEMEKNVTQEDKDKDVITSETENEKEVVEAESTSLGIDNLSIEPTSTTEQQLVELGATEKNVDNEDESVEQPSSTTETIDKSDKENLTTSNECEETKNAPGESGADTSIASVDLETNITSSKDADKSSDMQTESDDCTDRSFQSIANVDETAKQPSEEGVNDATESVMITCNNIDQSNDEEENSSNPIFVHVDTEREKNTNDKNNETTSTDNQDEDFQVAQPQEDPIASDDFIPVLVEDDVEELDQPEDDQINYEQADEEQGASEEMCIIPDTERVISQAERDAAAGMVPLCDPTESEAFSSDPSSDGISGETSAEKRKTSNPENYIVSVCTDEKVNACIQCCLPRKSKYSVLHNKLISFVCDDGCLNNFKRRHGDKVVINTEGDLRVKKLTSGINNDNMVAKVKFRRKCSECQKKLTLSEMHLSWEIMEFCNELCLSKYQKKVASNCSNCQAVVRNNCLGKYCVRFGYDIRQFCSSICLEEYKKGLKVCSYCQKDMSSGGGDGFLAPVGDKGQFKDFCTQLCMEKYDVMSNNRRQVQKPGSTCSVCLNEKPITIEFEHNGKINLFCGEPCFVAFKFVNNITPAKCNMCKKYFDNKILEEHSMFYDNALHSFCSKSCQNIYIIGHRKIVPCSWCKVKKYNFDMIKRSSTAGSSLLMCSLNCLTLYQVSINAVQSKKTKCDHCKKNLQPLYHLTMSDATMRNFCSYPCVMAFQNQFSKTPITLNEPEESAVPVPTGGPKRSKRTLTTKQPEKAPAEVPTMPVISNVQSLATTNGPTTGTLRARSKTNSDSSVSSSPPIVKTQIKQHFIIKPTPIPPQRNIGTLCKVNMQTKGVNFKPTTCNKEVQTDEIKEKTAIIPIPVPIYVPSPMWMYSMPFPVPFPFPLPVPVPIFIPTTRNSATGIMKEIKKIQVKIPTDPFEAELLMMAEMVAGDKKEEHTDSESEEEDTAPPPDEATFSPEPVDASNTFGDDMLQMALKMATELDEPAVDLEGALTANTITASQGTEPAAVEEPPEEAQPIHHIMERQATRGRKRPGRPPKTGGTISKRGRRSSSQMETPIMAPPQPPPPAEPVEKPDANMCLKYTFGVNAWKQWVTTKNAELEKTSRRVKLFKPEILQLTADELNYSLCLFVKEVRKPNGQEYAPDTIYYLCLGIQQYLFENARIDNIFCDSYYEKFTDCLDEVAKKFSILYNDSHYIVTRVEEEHLWESKQLGAHSPHVLLSTLMFFNTKHFNLTTVDEHMQLSFSHIMKHWKRNSHNQPGTAKMAGSRNVLLRFYPPQTNSADASQRKKKVYEQQENEDNPLRCPVKLYEFYLSKCPESVKTRNDVFYLLPERSCVPDSPVWYSTMPLPRAALEKMLHRVKMVKEINVALLTS